MRKLLVCLFALTFLPLVALAQPAATPAPTMRTLDQQTCEENFSRRGNDWVKHCKARRKCAEMKKTSQAARDLCQEQAGESSDVILGNEITYLEDLFSQMVGTVSTATATLERVATATAALTEQTDLAMDRIDDHEQRLTAVEKERRTEPALFEISAGPSAVVFYNGDVAVGARFGLDLVIIDSIVLSAYLMPGSALAASPRGTHFAFGYGGGVGWRALMSRDRQATLDVGVSYLRLFNTGEAEWDGPSFHYQGVSAKVGGKVFGFMKWGIEWSPLSMVRDTDHRSWTGGGPEQSAFSFSLGIVVDTVGDFSYSRQKQPDGVIAPTP